MESLPDEVEAAGGHTLSVIEPPRGEAKAGEAKAGEAKAGEAKAGEAKAAERAPLLQPAADPPAPTVTRPPQVSASAPEASSDDPWPEIELLLRRTDWTCIAQTLAGRDDLSPRLALMLAIAQKELNGETGADERAIAAMAGLLGVKPTSASAVVTAKRLLRRPRTDAPREQLSGVSSLLVVAIAVVTGLVGYFASDALLLLENL